jgi:hypothetical protein
MFFPSPVLDFFPSRGSPGHKLMIIMEFRGQHASFCLLCPFRIRGEPIQIQVTKTVAAAPADAFDVVANVAEWPQVMRSVKSVEVLTSGPIRAGTRVREHRVMFGAEGPHELEVATIDRPNRFRLLVEHPDLHYELDHLIDVVFGSGGSCRMALIFRSRPAAPTGEVLQPLMTPFMTVNLRDELERDLSDLADAAKARSAE